jgi:hypothetical protein
VLGRRTKGPRWASIFADDLVGGCEELFAAYRGGDELTLPISIPIDEGGLVLLRPEGPLDAPRVPATMAVTRRPGGAFGLALERRDGGAMRIPGFHDEREGDGTGSPAPLAALDVTLTRRGLDLAARAPDGEPVPLRFDEPAARALATALFITIRMKLAKAPRP